jgi:endonuclease YncB( thermonuclease family)
MAYKKNWFKKIALICFFILFSTVAPAHDQYTCSVYQVHDGDTFYCMLKFDDFFKLYKDIKVRLRHIDAPELSDGELGILAKEELTKLLKDKKVVLSALATDKYGRVGAEVRVDSIYVNELMIVKGLAIVPSYATGTEANRLRTLQPK